MLEYLLNSKVAANTIAFLLNRELCRDKVFACLNAYFQIISKRDYSDSKKEYDRPAAVYFFRRSFARAFLNSLAVIYKDSNKVCREALSKAFVHGFILQGIHARREKRNRYRGL